MTRARDQAEETPEEHPVFDFTRYSHRDALAMDRDLKRLMFHNRRINDTNDPGEFEAALDEYDDLMAITEGHLCRVLVSVPDAWLMPGAPPDLDWSLPESLGWLRQDRFIQLREEMTEARRPENVSKNSARR